MIKASHIPLLTNEHSCPQKAKTLLPNPLVLIDVIGSGRFFEDLADVLAKVVGFEGFHIFLYQTDAAPMNLINRPSTCKYERGMKNFLNYTYVVNPVFRAFQGNAASGVYLIADFVLDDFKRLIDTTDVNIRIEESESIGYRTPGWPKNMAECIVLLRLANGTALDFSFLIQRDSHQASACYARLKRVFPLLDRVVNKQFEIDPVSFDNETHGPGQEDWFQNFRGDVLTNREMQVVQLILVGHSSRSISLQLGVSISTIKSHRRNIYGKLQISSQAELFSLFLLHLK
ncbi:MAG: DNA-binding CsgD family transcriptional regulator [Paracoccaceae bacterium]|jgi:DNA-binding CsgD family transcriptional regulator